MLDGVKAAGDRQDLHEQIRQHAMASWHHMRVEGGDNDLLQRLQSDPAFAPFRAILADKPEAQDYIGRSQAQVDDFLAQVYEPIQKRYQALLGQTVATRV
jgi:adenylosuccinate lyase